MALALNRHAMARDALAAQGHVSVPSEFSLDRYRDQERLMRPGLFVQMTWFSVTAPCTWLSVAEDAIACTLAPPC
jgi:hypothetical protein